MAGGGGFRRRALTLGDGSRLVLERDGTVRAIATDGSVGSTWAPGDAGWEGQLIRFGVRPPTSTVAPRRDNALPGGIRP